MPPLAPSPRLLVAAFAVCLGAWLRAAAATATADSSRLQDAGGACEMESSASRGTCVRFSLILADRTAEG